MPSQVGTTYGTRFQFQGTGIVIYSGTGDPEGTQIGSVGDLYLRKDASAVRPPIYSKISGTDTTTGWTAIAGAGAVSANILGPSSASLRVTGNLSGGQAGGGQMSLTGNAPTVRVAVIFAPQSATIGATGNT